MTKGRAVPAQSAPPLVDRRQQEHAERRAALLTLEPAVMRAWAQRWNVPLLASSDAELLESMHGALMRDAEIPAERRLHSALLLAAAGDAVALALVVELQREGAGDAT